MFAESLLKLTKQLYPRGRAFKIPNGSLIERLHSALIVSEDKAASAATGILYSILPDNNDFTASDCTDWERRLGLITNESVSVADRKFLIKRKMNHPGTIQARQNYLYLQQQLQEAGFNVFVLENIPDSIISPLTDVQFDDFEFDDAEFGGFDSSRVINHIDAESDQSFDIGTSGRCTFYVGGSTLGTYASVPKDQESQFRQIILKTKPVQTVANLFINYI